MFFGREFQMVRGLKVTSLPVGDTSNPITYASMSRSPSYGQPIQTISTVHDLGILLTAGLSANDNVARATEKPVG